MNSLEKFKKFAKGGEKEISRTNEVWGYTRISSKDQFVNKSLFNQDQSIKQCAEENGWLLTKTFGGTYESASGDFTRKEFMRLITEVKKSKRKPYAILIYKVSRFSRTGGGGISMANELIETLGVNLYEISTGKNTFSEHGKLDIYNSLIEARRETVNKLEITIPGMKTFLSNGNWLGTVPKGWDHYGPRVRDRTKSSNEQKIILNEWGKKLQNAWKWKDQGFPDHEIVRKLAEIGITVRKQYLSAMWRNPFYCGVLTNRLLEGEVVKGNWERMVSVEVFMRIQERIDLNGGWQVKKENYRFPFSGMVSCGKCHEKMVGYSVRKTRKKDGQNYTIDYYKCNYCRGMNINVNTTKKAKQKGAHDMFLEYLSNFRLDPKYTNLFLKQLNVTFSVLNKDSKEERVLLQKELNSLKEDNKALKRRYALGRFDDEELYDEIRNELSEKILHIENKLGKSEIQLSNQIVFTKKSLKFLQNLPEIWSKGQFYIRQQIQNLVFPEGFILNDKKDGYLTKRVNEVFVLILSISGNYNHKKSGLPTSFFGKSAQVAGVGLEPTTFGL